jgi:autotransporter-associated beta strand protein
MKKSNHRSLALSLAVALLLAYGPHQAISATTTYSFNTGAATNTAWSTLNWSTTGSAPFNTSWVNGDNTNPSIASFTFSSGNRIVLLNDETIVFGALGGITTLGVNNVTVSGGTGPTSTLNLSGATLSNPDTGAGGLILSGNLNVNMSGATVSVAGARTVQFSGNTTVSGNFSTQNPGSGTGVLNFNSDNPYDGTVTINAGTSVNPAGANGVSTASNMILSGGLIQPIHTSGIRTMGTLQMNSGIYEIGPGSGLFTTTVSHTQLTGAGGSFRPRQPSNDGLNNGSFGILQVNQTTNTTVGSLFQGTNQRSGFPDYWTYLNLTKEGTGNLTLTGTLQSLQNVRVEGGGLWVSAINANQRSFGNQAGAIGSSALTIADGGTFGGDFSGNAAWNLTINGNRNIEVESGGRLSPGLVDGSGNATIGLLRISFPDGGAVDLTDAVGNSGWLRFDLGANTTAGTTYDQINLTSGTLLIGNSLQFSDFQFTPTSGFDVGTYTLFSLTGTSALSGTLAGSGLTGNITSGYTGTLSLSGNSILLTVEIAVIPEPKTSLLLLGGVVLWFVSSRRRRMV